MRRELFDIFKDIREKMFFSLSDLSEDYTGFFTEESFNVFLEEKCADLLDEFQIAHISKHKDNPTISLDYMIENLEYVLNKNIEILENTKMTERILKRLKKSLKYNNKVTYRQVKWLFQCLNYILYREHEEKNLV